MSTATILAINLKRSDPERRKPLSFLKGRGHWYRTIRGRRKCFLSLHSHPPTNSTLAGDNRSDQAGLAVQARIEVSKVFRVDSRPRLQTRSEDGTEGNRYFRQSLKKTGVQDGRGFYSLRRTFQTKAEESGDLVARASQTKKSSLQVFWVCETVLFALLGRLDIRRKPQ